MRGEVSGSHSQGELTFPEWQAPLLELIRESDRDKSHQKSQNVENLISDRLRQLAQENDGRDEEQALNDALTNLRVIQRNR
jgi:hypothetical protein